MNPTIPPRPKRSDAAIIDAAALRLTTDLAKHLNEDADGIFPDVRKAIQKNSHNLDGYQIAKDLDYMGWDIDSQLVEELDTATSHLHTALEKACEEWAKTHNLQEPPLGTYVHQIGKEEKNGIGKIVRNMKDGRSTVCFTLLGHNEAGPGTIGLILPWEELTILHQP